MNRRILSVACLVALVPCGAAIADDDFGLSKMSIYSTPDPIVTTTKAGEPGENELIDAYFDESPPVIPHVVDEYLPITISDNQCIDCHDAPDQIGKKLAKDEAPPSPASHYTDLRRAPDKVTNTLIGSRGIDRRAFLRGSWFERSAAVVPGTRLLKPSPPCLPRDSLGRSPCIDCDGPCVDACPEQVIEATVGERAKLSFAGGGCTFCGDCLEVCPQARDAAEKEIGAANIIRSECLAWQGVVCMSCRLACGDGAIEMDAKNRPKMRDRACTGCGLCVAPCPSDAIDVRVSVALS